jgi:hypothetical protein
MTSGITQFSGLLLRYAAAIALAFAASITTFALLAFLAASLQMTSDGSPALSSIFAFLFNAIPGFTGVFVGVRCLSRPHHIIGACVLLVVAVGFEIIFFMSLPGGHAGFPRGVVPSAVGGLLAVGFFYWRSRANQPIQGTA